MTYDVEAATRIIGRAARDLDIPMLTDYSGRGMFGATCLAVIQEPDTWHDLDDLLDSIGEHSISEFDLDSPSTDSMGRGMVMYWRHLRSKPSQDDPTAVDAQIPTFDLGTTPTPPPAHPFTKPPTKGR